MMKLKVLRRFEMRAKNFGSLCSTPSVCWVRMCQPPQGLKFTFTGLDGCYVYSSNVHRKNQHYRSVGT